MEETYLQITWVGLLCYYFATYNIGIHLDMFGNIFCICLRNWYFFGLVRFETLWEIATKVMENHITTTFEPGIKHEK